MNYFMKMKYQTNDSSFVPPIFLVRISLILQHQKWHQKLDLCTQGMHMLGEKETK